MSDSNTPYDPTAPDGDDAARSQYVSKRDLRVILVGIGVLAIILFPVYKLLERNAQKAVCAQNMKAISTALNEYAVVHDDRYPPIMRTLTNGSPDLGESGLPYTWASDIKEFMSPRSSFRCATADSSEVVTVEGVGGERIPLTYGMYSPYGSYLRSVIDNPDSTIVVSETSNYGAMKTFNPEPYVDLSGNPIPHDGFVIGWNDGNDQASKESAKVTRLAFYDTNTGEFGEKARSRHDGGIHTLTATGGAGPLLKPGDAIVQQRDELPSGLWEVPPVQRKKRTTNQP